MSSAINPQRYYDVPIDLVPSIVGAGPYSPKYAWAAIVRHDSNVPVSRPCSATVEAWCHILRDNQQFNVRRRGPAARIAAYPWLDFSSILQDDQGVPWIFVRRETADDAPWIRVEDVPARARVLGAMAMLVTKSKRVGYFGPPNTAEDLQRSPVLAAVEDRAPCNLTCLIDGVANWVATYLYGSVPIEPPWADDEWRDGLAWRHLHPVGDRSNVLELTDEQERLVQDYHARSIRHRLEGVRLKQQLGHIRDMMGDAGRAFGSNVEVSLLNEPRGGYRQKPSAPRVLKVRRLRAHMGAGRSRSSNASDGPAFDSDAETAGAGALDGSLPSAR